MFINYIRFYCIFLMYIMIAFMWYINYVEILPPMFKHSQEHVLGPTTMKKYITSKCYSILQLLLQILTWEGETYRSIYNLSTFGGIYSLKIRPVRYTG